MGCSGPSEMTLFRVATLSSIWPVCLRRCSSVDSVWFTIFFKGYNLDVEWKNILENFERQSKWDIVVLLLALFFVFLLSESSPFLVPALSSLLVSPKGTEESVAAGHTGGHGVYYVRCVGEGGWYSTEAYLVLVNMALQWDVQTKSNACKTWTILIDWTAGLHKGKHLADNQKDTCTRTHSNLVLLTKVLDRFKSRELAPVLLFKTVCDKI